MTSSDRRCPRCRGDNPPDASYCGSCGRRLDAVVGRAPSHALAIASLVIGVAGCPLVFSNRMGAPRAGPETALAVVLGAVAVALALTQRYLLRREPRRFGGPTLATAGCLFGAFNLVVSGCLVLVSPPSGTAREAYAIGDARSVIAAQADYAQANGGFFDSLECLARPEHCLSSLDPERPRFIDADLASLATRHGYRRTFHPGPRATPEQIRRAKASTSSLLSFAYVAVPERSGGLSVRGFCADDTGQVCFTPDGKAPPVKDGRCVRPCLALDLE